jgi:hypothetical protein
VCIITNRLPHYEKIWILLFIIEYLLLTKRQQIPQIKLKVSSIIEKDDVN